MLAPGGGAHSTTAGNPVLVAVITGSTNTCTGIIDNKTGNTYAALHAAESWAYPGGGGDNQWLQFFGCPGLASGGAGAGSGHTFTGTFSAAAPYATIIAVEITGAAASAPFDTACYTYGQITSSQIPAPPPFLMTSNAFAQADELVFLLEGSIASGTSTYAATGFTSVAQNGDNSTWAAGLLSKNISSTAALSISATDGVSSAMSLTVIAVKSATAGGITGAGQIASGEAFGAVVVGAGVAPAGIASAQAFGAPVISAGIAPAGIASAGAVGAPALGGGITAVGIASAQALGAPTVAASVFAAGIASAEAFGAPVVGGIGIFAAGIPSAEVFGQPAVAAVISAAGIVSEEGAGAPTVGTPAPPATRFGGFEMACPREVSFKPLSQRILEARNERRVKPAKERAAKRAKAIEVEAAFVALDTGNQARFQTLMAQWLAQRPVLPPAVEPSALFLAQVLFRIQQMQAEEALRARLRAQRDEEEALIALLLT
ncbi:hypothetical protein [Variovorax sp. PBL-E5]|uniref:hypothetical protein n=1 Tax=Variovorax sp. PBL-E5 TaxID=434014 RepID=UPI0013A5B444|nr:hypothetical protein [Variovorax sp. PBL-E5]